jgi:hypothetical protein
MVLLMKAYEKNPVQSTVFLPLSEKLSNTPLLQAMIAMKDIMVDFKKKNNLDLTNLVIVHDGDADKCRYYTKAYGDNHNAFKSTSINPSVNTVIIDNKIKFQYQLKSDEIHEGMTKAIFEWFQKSTESKIFGFFLAPTNYRGQTMKALENQFYDETGKKIIVFGVSGNEKRHKITPIFINEIGEYKELEEVETFTLFNEKNAT